MDCKRLQWIFFTLQESCFLRKIRGMIHCNVIKSIVIFYNNPYSNLLKKFRIVSKLDR